MSNILIDDHILEYSIECHVISPSPGNTRETPMVEDGMLCGQNFEELRASALEAGELFTDPEFPPDDGSLYFSESPPFAFEWKRASELADDPCLFEAGSSRFDINQVRRGINCEK